MNQKETGAGSRLPTAPVAEGGALASHEGESPTSHTELSNFAPPPVLPPRLPTAGTGSRAPSAGKRAATGPTAPGGAAEPPWIPTSGMRLRQYELIRPLGSGGMGTVFLARDMKLGRRVAIKFLHAAAPDITQRFLFEARITARCSHENIVVIHEVGEFRGCPFMVLEYLQGQTLTQVVAGARLPPPRAVELLVPVVRALACAHAENIVHRDLKPDNILVTEAGTIKVLDFGIAKVVQEPEGAQGRSHAERLRSASEASEDSEDSQGPSHLTRRGALVGTLPYMSPEQWGNGVPVDHRTDIWAVGIMLFRLLAGKHPLDPLRGPQLAVTAFPDEKMPRLRDAAPEVPPELAAVVDQCLLKNRDERFADARALLRALEPFLPGRYTRELRVDESPYTGLSSFQEADAARFFGRTREISALVSRLRDRPLLAVVGPSGAGKSSFVRAGLVPVLKGSGEAWESYVVRPGRQPMTALAHLLAPLVTSSTSLADDLKEHHQLDERLRREPGILGSVLRHRARAQHHRILLFVDQFEELYTLVPDAEERRAFTACLSGLADDATSPIRVVLSLRSDFLDRVYEDERFLAELNQGLFFLTTPQREGLREALTQPAEMAGYRFETPAMVEGMLQHLESAQGALPLLQFAATQLWERRDPARKLLTEQSYTAMGGIAGALASHADSVLSGLSPQGNALARTVLLRLVTPERTRAIVSVEELSGLAQDTRELQRVTDQLVQARLLVVQTGGGGTGATVELVHESLIHTWPTLKRWLDEGQEDSGFLEELRNAARQWQAKKRDSGLLWGGEMVEEARRFQRRYRGELPEMQQDFLKAVFTQAARAVRRKRTLVVGALVLMALLLAASAVALVVIRNAQHRAERNDAKSSKAAEDALLAQAKAEASARAEFLAKEEAKQNLQRIETEAEQRKQAELRTLEVNKQLLLEKSHAERSMKEAQRAKRRALAAKRQSDVDSKAAREAEEKARRETLEKDRLLKESEERRRRLSRDTFIFKDLMENTQNEDK